MWHRFVYFTIKTKCWLFNFASTAIRYDFTTDLCFIFIISRSVLSGLGASFYFLRSYRAFTIKSISLRIYLIDTRERGTIMLQPDFLINHAQKMYEKGKHFERAIRFLKQRTEFYMRQLKVTFARKRLRLQIDYGTNNKNTILLKALLQIWKCRTRNTKHLVKHSTESDCYYLNVLISMAFFWIFYEDSSNTYIHILLKIAVASEHRTIQNEFERLYPDSNDWVCATDGSRRFWF